MRYVPIADENLDFIKLDLSRHYLQVDIDFTAYIVLNPSGVIPKGGSDICVLHVGAWQIDTWSFLTDKFTKDTPGFSACLVWDKSLITDIAHAPQVAESDIDTANSVSSLKGQPVNITGFSMADGQSLPVRTLDEQFCSVRSFDIFKDEHFNLFPAGGAVYRYAVGDVFNFNKISSFCNIEEVEGGYKFIPPKVSGGEGNGGSRYNSLCICNFEFGWKQYISSSNQENCGLGLVTDYSVIVTVDSDSIITGISIKAAGMLKMLAGSGGTQWGAALNIELPCNYILVGF